MMIMKKFISILFSIYLIAIINVNFLFGQEKTSTFKVGGASGLNASANETITGDWSFTGSVSFVTVTITTLTATTPFKLSYDATNYATFTVVADGALTITTVDAAAAEADINLNPDGFVGIKTAVPTNDLEITVPNTSGRHGITIYVTGDGSTGDAGIMLKRSSGLFGEMFLDGNVGWMVISNGYNSDSGDIRFSVKGDVGTNPAFYIEGNKDVHIGLTVVNELRPSFSILGDALNTGSTSGETFSIVLIGADPATNSIWRASNTNNLGFDFDMPLTASSIIIDDGGDIYAGVNGNEENWLNLEIFNDSTVTGETTWSSVLPAGYIIESIIFKNTTANEITNLDIGFSDAGGEIVAAANLLASDEGSFTINQRVDDFNVADNVFISADNWNSASVIIYIRIVRIF